jgi:hypothetical protein
MSMERRRSPRWLTSIEMLGTTIVVLMVGAMVLWLKAGTREARIVFTIGSGLLVYAVGVVALGRRSSPSRISVRPFALAGLCAGAIAELVNAQFLLTREFAVAGLTGAAIGLAHWAALRTWLRLTGDHSA